MIELVILVLIGLWFLGYIQIPGLIIPDLTLFILNGQPVTLINTLIFMLILFAISILPSPFREISTILLIVWVLSIFGILAVAGISQWLVIAIIVGLIASLFFRTHNP